MKFKAKLNLKFYIAFLLLLGIVLLGWKGIYFLNTNEIMMEDNTPMNVQTKMLFTIALSSVVLSWTLSFLAVIRQAIVGYAFAIDENGIHNTSTAINVLAFIFVVPIRSIPLSAIEKASEVDGNLILHIDKMKMDMIPILRIFVRKSYHLFSGFTVEKQDAIKAELEKYIKIDSENNLKFKPTPPMPSWEKIVEMLYDKQLSISGELIRVIYSKDRSMRYLVIKDEKGLYSYCLEEIFPFDDDEWEYISQSDDALPAMWETPAGRTDCSLFANEEDLMRELKSEPEYTQYFSFNSDE